MGGFLHADSEDSDQTGRIPMLIWVFARRTVILFFSWGGSYVMRRIISQMRIRKKKKKKKTSTPKPVYNMDRYNTVLDITRLSVGHKLVI